MSSTLPIEVLQALQHIVSVRRFEKTLPSGLDRDFLSVAEYFKGASPDDRRSIMLAISPESRTAILEFGTRMAILAERTANRQLVVASLMAHAIEGAQLDSRENLLRLALVTHIVNKLKFDEHQIFEEVASIAEPEVASLLRGFASRSPDMKTLWYSGLEEVQTAEGICYRQRESSFGRTRKAKRPQ
jgi:hypothetical protein